MEKVIAEVETSRGVVCLREWRDQRQLSPGRSREAFRALRDSLLSGWGPKVAFKDLQEEMGVIYHAFRV
jgi:hypothetical protein